MKAIKQTTCIVIFSIFLLVNSYSQRQIDYSFENNELVTWTTPELTNGIDSITINTFKSTTGALVVKGIDVIKNQYTKNGAPIKAIVRDSSENGFTYVFRVINQDYKMRVQNDSSIHWYYAPVIENGSTTYTTSKLESSDDCNATHKVIIVTPNGSRVVDNAPPTGYNISADKTLKKSYWGFFNLHMKFADYMHHSPCD